VRVDRVAALLEERLGLGFQVHRGDHVVGANDPDQWLATTRLSTPQGFIASPLHRVVRRIPGHSEGQASRLPRL
jgi:hypothetical protein